MIDCASPRCGDDPAPSLRCVDGPPGPALANLTVTTPRPPLGAPRPAVALLIDTIRGLLIPPPRRAGARTRTLLVMLELAISPALKTDIIAVILWGIAFPALVTGLIVFAIAIA